MPPAFQEDPTPPGRSAPWQTGLDPLLAAHVLDQFDYAVWLLDGRGTLRHASAAALQECSSARSLRIVDGRLKTVRVGDDARLNTALGESRRGRRGMLKVGSRPAAIWLAVIPIEWGDPAGGFTLLLARQQDPDATLTLDFFARVHQLTPAESAVLRGLAQGLRPAQIADVGSVSVSTVRTHISAIGSKTAATSIRDLVQGIALLPPIRTLVRSPGVARCPTAPHPAALRAPGRVIDRLVRTARRVCRALQEQSR